MADSGRRPVGVAAAVALGALLLTAPAPTQALADLRDPGSAADPTAPLVAAVALIAWPLALWLAVTVLLTLAARSPSRVGRVAASAARRTAPVAVRRAVELSLGLSVVVGVASPAVATQEPAGPTPVPPAASLDWAGTPAPSLDWPTTAPQEPAATEVRAAPVAAAGEVVVRPGDTLWDLTEQSLADRTGAPPSDAQVAAAWPSWWAANRDAVGDDPHLLRPGTPLTPPADPS